MTEQELEILELRELLQQAGIVAGKQEKKLFEASWFAGQRQAAASEALRHLALAQQAVQAGDRLKVLDHLNDAMDALA